MTPSAESISAQDARVAFISSKLIARSIIIFRVTIDGTKFIAWLGESDQKNRIGKWTRRFRVHVNDAMESKWIWLKTKAWNSMEINCMALSTLSSASLFTHVHSCFNSVEWCRWLCSVCCRRIRPDMFYLLRVCSLRCVSWPVPYSIRELRARGKKFAQPLDAQWKMKIFFAECFNYRCFHFPSPNHYQFLYAPAYRFADTESNK